MGRWGDDPERRYARTQCLVTGPNLELLMVHAKHRVKTAAVRAKLAKNAAKFTPGANLSRRPATWPQPARDWFGASGDGPN
jgi:hypothetical protein